MSCQSGSWWRAPGLWVTLTLTALASAPLWSDPGFLITRGAGDSPFLLWRVFTLAESLRAGDFPARWAVSAAYGYGLPLWNFYAPLAFTLAAGLHLLGLPVVAALKATQTLALALGAWGMWGWTGTWGWPRPARALAASAYTFAPMHLVNLYVRGDSLAELFAMGLFPLAFWSLQAAYAAPTRLRLLALTLSVAGLALTHNVSAFIAAPFMALYLGILLLSGWRARSAVSVAGAGLLGLALSAFFWLPALAESATVQLGVMQGGFFFYGNHFRAGNLVQATLAFDYDPNGNPFSMGLTLTALAGLGAVRGWWRARAHPAGRGPLIGLTLMAALTTLLVTPLSAPLWQAVPGLSLLQFPWRWLTLQSLALAGLAGWAVIGARWPTGLALALSLAVGWAGLAGVRPVFLPLPDAALTREALWQFDALTGTQASQIGGEYLPVNAQPHPRASAEMLGRAPTARVLAGEAAGQRLSLAGARQTWQVTVSETASLAVPLMWWPGWQAHDQTGQAWPTRPAPGLGWLTLDDVPPGAYTFTLRLARTPVRAVAELWALTAGLAVLVSAGRAWRRWLTLRLLGLAALMLALGALAAWPRPAPAPTAPLNLDLQTLAFPHRDVVRFGAAFTLTRALWDGQTVTTTWQAEEPFTATLSVQSLAGLTLATVTTRLQAGENRTPLAVPPDLWGLHWLSVDVAGAPPRTITGQPRASVWLEPRLLTPHTPSSPPAAPTVWDGVTLAAHRASVTGQRALITPVWYVTAPNPFDVAVSVRVADALGQELARADAPPAVPASLWQAGDMLADPRALTLPEGAPPGVYTITALAYDPLTLHALGAVSWAETLTPFTPRGQRVPQARLSDALAVETATLPASVAAGDRLPARLAWLTAAPVPAHTPATFAFSGPALFSLTVPLNEAAWPAGAYVQTPLAPRLPLTAPPGAYTVRLEVNDTWLPLGALTVTASARSFVTPSLPITLSAAFGDLFDLTGAALTPTADSLTVQLAWRARKTPPREYHYFVHALAADAHTILAQADAAPGGLPHPATDLLPGQTWLETVTLALPSPPAWLAIGWYDPTPPAYPRLTTTAPDNRFLIPLPALP